VFDKVRAVADEWAAISCSRSLNELLLFFYVLTDSGCSLSVIVSTFYYYWPAYT